MPLIPCPDCTKYRRWLVVATGVLLVVILGGISLRWSGDQPLTEWEKAKCEALSDPPANWSCADSDPYRQQFDFERWKKGRLLVVPEVYPIFFRWIHGDQVTIEQVVTNDPTGAQYHVTGSRGEWGASFRIRFIGNLNWD